MRQKSATPINLATLAWLDRRRIWATAGRDSALGASRIQVNPSLVGGQGSRPMATHRHFTANFTWALTALASLSSLVTILYLTVKILSYALSGLASSTILALDNFTCAVSPTPLSQFKGAVYWHEGSGALTNVELVRSLYSVVGSLDATSNHLTSPCVWQSSPIIDNSQAWSALLNSPKVGWARACSPCTAPHDLPLFKEYFGEWRRLLDQSSDSTPLHMQWLAGGPAVSSRVRLSGSSSLIRARPLLPILTPKAQLAEAKPVSYSFYLSSPWYF